MGESEQLRFLNGQRYTDADMAAWYAKAPVTEAQLIASIRMEMGIYNRDIVNPRLQHFVTEVARLQKTFDAEVGHVADKMTRRILRFMRRRRVFVKNRRRING